MANRIMYSVIPSLATPGEVAGTGGVVDYKALKQAAAGRHRVLEFGIRAVQGELRHYNRIRGANEKFASKISSFGRESALEYALTTFEDEGGWSRSYGGRAWAQIAKSLLQLARLDQSLFDFKMDKGSPEKEIALLKDVVVQLNVFDGLAHNTDSILRNLVELETMDNMQGKDENAWDEGVKNYEKMKDVMDAKELEDPMEVYKRIEPTLQDSGDINRYKDWTNKLRSKPEYHKDNEMTATNLFLIRMRKVFLSTRGYINNRIDKARSHLSMFKNDIINDPENLDPPSLNDFRTNLPYASSINPFSEMNWYIQKFIESYTGIAGLDKAIGVGERISGKGDQLISEYNKVADLFRETADDIYLARNNMDPEEAAKTLTSLMEQCITKMSAIVFYLDTI